MTPDWAQSISGLAPNRSFLDHWSEQERGAQEQLLDPKSTTEMQLRYFELSRNYRLRENYGIATSQDERDFHGKAEELSRQLFRMIINYQMQSRLRKAEKNSSEIRTFANVQKATEKMTLKVDENIRFGTRTDLPGQKGKLWMTTPYVNGALDVDFSKPWETDVANLDPGQRVHDRYRLSFTRGLPVWDLRSGLSYGFSSTVMTASVSKDLLAGLSCELFTRRGFDEAVSGLGGSEEAVKLLYSIQF